jgi:lipoprotein-anchoring transpeptidase ErfK/SrfK
MCKGEIFMKKRIVSLLLSVAMIATLCVNAHASTLTYDFTGYAVPTGQPMQLNVDASTIELMRVNPAYIIGFVDALAIKYNIGDAAIDKASEIRYLQSVVLGPETTAIRKPVYKLKPSAVPETSAIAAPTTTTTPAQIPVASSVDVNITTQTLTVISNGVAVLSTPIVTGNIKAGNGTPTGTFSALYKQRNRTLIGPHNSYRSFVNYWIRIVNNVGIHDATWRSNFGGNIYNGHGSHGCINVPLAAMPAIYEAVSLGTPVNVHY